MLISIKRYLMALGVCVCGLLLTSAQLAEAQDNPASIPEDAVFALNQGGYSLAGLSNRDEPVEITEEQRLILEAILAGNPEVYETASQGYRSAQASASLLELSGLFSVFEGILIDGLCELVCDENATDIEKISDVRDLMTDHYINDNRKYFGYVSAGANLGVVNGTATLYFDLNDLVAITEEGGEGWVTVWINVGGGAGFSLGDFLPVGLGVVPFEFDPLVQDPTQSWTISFISGSIPFYACTGITIDANGEVAGGCEPNSQVSISIDASLFDIEVNLERLELNTSYLGRASSDFLDVLLADLPTIDGSSTLSDISDEFIGFLLNVDFNGVLLAFVPQDNEKREFSCQDDGGLCEQDGKFDIVGGCLDLNDNGIPDNVCQPNPDGTVNAEISLEFTALSVLANGDIPCYTIIDIDLPNGWIGTRPYGVGDVIAINPRWADCDRLEFGESVTKIWPLERTDPSAADSLDIEFKLFSATNPVPGNDGNELDSVTITVIVDETIELDVDDNGLITPEDAIYAANRVGSNDLSADTNNDGVVTIADVGLIISAIGTRE